MTEKISLAKIIENAHWDIELLRSVHRVVGPFDKMEISGETGHAIRSNNVELVKWLISLPESDINYKVDNYSHIEQAISVRNIDIVKILIDAGADLGYVEKDSKRTLLHIACLYPNVDILKLLLTYEQCTKTIQTTCVENKTPLDYACGTSTTEFALWNERMYMAKELLLHYEAPPILKGGLGNNPVHVAVMARDLHLLKEFIVEYKISPYLANKSETPRDLAQRLGYREIVKFIDELGTDDTDESKKDDEEEFVDVPLVEFNEATVAEWCKKNGYILGKAI